MAYKTISFRVGFDGITPSTRQRVGMQKNHNMVELEFEVEPALRVALQDNEASEKVVCRFEIYNAAGEVFRTASEDVLERFDDFIFYYDLQERDTRYGGIVKVVLVLTALDGTDTVMESYSFPALLQVESLPEGVASDGESRVSYSELELKALEAAKVAKDAAGQAVEASAAALEVKQAYDNGELKGGDGADGFSPTVDVEQIEGGHRVTITDKSGENTFDVMDSQGGGESGGATNYEKLPDKPKINGVELSGNKTTQDLGIKIPTKLSELDNDKGYLTEHQDISGKLDASNLPEAINDALEQAKASGEFDGNDGADGKDGTSVTVSKVTESTADGGSNVVTFSDGKTLTVRNGSEGKKGDTGEQGPKGDTGATGSKGADGKDGRDYIITAADKQEIKNDILSSIITQEAGESESLVMSQKAVTDLVAEAVGTGGGTSTEYETVDSVDEMTDTSKQYVLKETGTIWAYGEFKTGPQELYDPSKISVGYRHSSGTGGATTNGGETYLMTDYIPVDMSVSEPKLEVHGNLNQQGGTVPSFYKIGYYNADKTCIGSKIIKYNVTNNTQNIHATNSNGVTTLYIGMSNGAKESYYSNIAFVRIDFVPTGSAATSASANLITSIINPDASGTTYMWYDTEIVPSTNGGGGNYVELLVKVNKNTTDITEVSNRVTALETGSESVTIPTFWQSAVDACIAKIKALQVGRNCVTFPFFSDNHQNNKGAGHLIAYVMKKCNIPYCFFGGDAISNGSDVTSEAIMIEQDSKFDQMMSVVPVEKMCRALGNHDAYWNPTPDSGSSTRVYYSREQIYDLFLRQESVSQNKHYGGDGTYYYVDDIASKTRFVVCNTNVNVNTTTEKLDSEQVDWLENEVLVFNEGGWSLAFISHQPITNHYHSNIYAETANAIQTLLTNYANSSDTNKAEIVGWFSGHIHADRIYTGVASNTSDDSVKNTLPWKTVTIRADHTGLCRDTNLTHTPSNDDQSHAIDFVTINKSTRTVNITRLGIGSDRSYTY